MRVGMLPTTLQTMAQARMNATVTMATQPTGEVTCMRTSRRSGEASFSMAALRNSWFSAMVLPNDEEGRIELVVADARSFRPKRQELSRFELEARQRGQVLLPRTDEL